MKILLMTMVGLFGVCTSLPILIVQQHSVQSPYAHPDVLANSAMEEALPEELKNHFYKDPNIAAALAKESWFGNKETQVVDREATKIPRQKIFDVLHNAGLTKR